MKEHIQHGAHLQQEHVPAPTLRILIFARVAGQRRGSLPTPSRFRAPPSIEPGVARSVGSDLPSCQNKGVPLVTGFRTIQCSGRLRLVRFLMVLLSAALLIASAGTLHAQLVSYWTTNNPSTATNRPAPGGGGGWTPMAPNPDGSLPPGGAIPVPAGVTITFAIENIYDPADKKVLTVEITTQNANDIHDLNPTGEAEGRDPNGNRIPRWNFNGGFRNKPGQPSRRHDRYVFVPCPAWEKVTYKNTTAPPRPITITSFKADSKCGKDLAVGSMFRAQACSFAAPGILVLGNQLITNIMVFPEFVGIDPSSPPVFSAPADTGNWVAVPAEVDPDGNERPLGGWSFATDGPGLQPGEPCDFSFNVLGASAALPYTMYAFDAVGGTYQEFELDLRVLLDIQTSGTGKTLISWPASQTGLILEATTDLQSAAWTPVTLDPVVDPVNDRMVVSVPAAAGRQFFRLTAGGPVAGALEETLTTSAAHAFNVRNVTFETDGAWLAGPDVGIDYFASFFPAQGTIEAVLNPTGPGGRILNTRGRGPTVMGDAILSLNELGQAVFAIVPLAGMDLDFVPGVTSMSMVDDGFFHTISVSYGSGGLKLYIDGALEDSRPDLTTPLVRSTMTVGAYPDGATSSFSGVIRRLRTSPVQDDLLVRKVETPCDGGVLTSGYTAQECIGGFWHTVEYTTYACPPDWQRKTYRTKDTKTDQPCSTNLAVLDETLTQSAAQATHIRDVTFGESGAGFNGSSSALEYSPNLFPVEGTIQLELSTTAAGCWILGTTGNAFSAPGDAIMRITSQGQVSFAIAPSGGQDLGTLTGVTSMTVVNDGLFHTVSVSYGSDGLQLYVDGVLEDFNRSIATPLIPSTITFGGYSDSPLAPYGGALRHVRTVAVQGANQQPWNAVQGPFNFTNTTGFFVNDLHVVFTGSGGTLNNPRITIGPPGSTITAQGEQVDLQFPNPVPPGAPVEFVVQSRFPIAFYEGWWTINGLPVGPAVPNP